ncbi:MAG: hypothetical protein EB084_09015 [Proteobacteria bacterium]|nr:hypothetical protein [Pseudomonadota bacterium]
MRMSAEDGLGTRTMISFSKIIERSRGYHLRDFVIEEPLVNERYLLQPLTRPISSYWKGWVLVQAARRTGRFTVEIAMALHDRYPLHNGLVRPFFGVDGVRERAANIDGREDGWYEYRSQEQLTRVLGEATQRAASTGFNHLYERHAATIVREAKRAQDLLNQWEARDAQAGEAPLGQRFPELEHELRAAEFVSNAPWVSSMRPVLGDAAWMLSDARRRSALTYVMASLMATTDEAEMSQNIYVPAVLDDEAGTMCGRTPFYLYLDPSDSFDERVDRFCFFKALDIVEAQFAPTDRLQLSAGVRTRGFDLEQ